jgi:hypothetical protein
LSTSNFLKKALKVLPLKIQFPLFVVVLKQEQVLS